MQNIRMLFLSHIASFAHERIRHMVMCFSRYSVTTAKHADKLEPIKYLGKNITICLILFCAKVDKIAFLYFTLKRFSDNENKDSKQCLSDTPRTAMVNKEN